MSLGWPGESQKPSRLLPHRTCDGSRATFGRTNKVAWVLPHQQDGGFIDVGVMISTLEHNKSSTPLGQTINARQWVKIKPTGSIKAFIRVHHPFSLISGFIFFFSFSQINCGFVWSIITQCTTVFYCVIFVFVFFSAYSKDWLPASPALPTSIPHAEYACGSHDKIHHHIPDGKWQTWGP